MTKGIGTDECGNFRKNHFLQYEPICLTLASGYRKIAEEEGYVKANQSLLRLEQSLKIADFNVSFDSDKTTAFAKQKASICDKYTSDLAEAEAHRACRQLIAPYNFTIPDPSKMGAIKPCLERYKDYRWWRRHLHKLQKRRIDEVARDLRTVHHNANPYASGWAIQSRRNQNRRNDAYLSATSIANNDGQSFTLKEIADRTVSNPYIRRAELMTRAKGFEMVANQALHQAVFFTITTPSRMHAQLRYGKHNPKFDGTTPKEANDYLNHIWKCMRAKLHRSGLGIYGFRVVEPHHDGTPHWHLLLFMTPEHVKPVSKILRDYSLKEDGHEPGASKQRFKAVLIDPDKGSATGYIAKYITKNIDGSHIKEDLYGNSAPEAAERIDAWASTHGIRQFQQIGGPSVSVWRELRRLKAEESGQMAEAYTAADAGDWAAYVMVMGGPNLKRVDRAISLLYEAKSIALPSGELNPEALTRYGDLKKPTICGLISGTVEVLTRLRKWHVLKTIPTDKLVLPQAVPT